ncbi:hypothetical protein THIOKS11720013 [Thiocapsa sp. KS1]|nr:hypothetical protein THIOKS11720013 [Thiocapsa sp. KS1]
MGLAIGNGTQTSGRNSSSAPVWHIGSDRGNGECSSMSIQVKTKFSDVLAILGAVASTVGLVLAIVSWLDISRDLLISVISSLVAFLAGVFSSRLATRVKSLMGSPRVFLSYPAALTVEVKAIAELLRRRGAQVWLDQERLKPGQDWRSEIARAMEDADTLLVFIGDEPSPNVAFELGLAEGRGKRIIPVRAGGAELPSDIQGLRYIDLRADRDVGLEQLIESATH